MNNQLIKSANTFLQQKNVVKDIPVQPIQPVKTSFFDTAKNFIKKSFTNETPLWERPVSIEKKIEPTIKKISQIPLVRNTLTNIAKMTSGTGIHAAIKASSPDITFNEAYESIRKSQAEKNDTFQEKFLTQLKDAAPQTLIGVALNFVPFAGKPLSVAYWSSISSGSEIEEKGYFTPTNVAIDVLGDRMLGNSLEGLLKKPAKTLWNTVRKAFGVEAGTEVAQDLLKFGNDYRLSDDEKEKSKIIAEAKDYFTSGQILITAGVGGVMGGGIGAGGYTIQKTSQQVEQEAQSISKEKGISIEQARKEAKQRGSIQLPDGSDNELGFRKEATERIVKFKEEIETPLEQGLSFIKRDGAKQMERFSPKAAEIWRNTDISNAKSIDDAKEIIKRAIPESEKIKPGVANTIDNFPETVKRVLDIPKESKPLSIPMQKSIGKQISQKESKEIKPEIQKANLPAVIQGETFTLGESRFIQPSIKELKAKYKLEIKARDKEIKNADIAKKKAEKLELRKQEIRKDTIKNINSYRGNTEEIIDRLKNRYLSQEDIDNIVLENGVKLVDTIKIKRNNDKSLASVIIKDDFKKLNYNGKKPDGKWVKTNSVEDIKKTYTNIISKYYELPAVWFEARGLEEIYNKNIEGQRAAEYQKTQYLNKFKEAGLFKHGNIFTADNFTISKQESENIAKYYLSRQNRGFIKKIEDLSSKEQKFVKIFDDIIEDTETRFYETAKKVGKVPGKVDNYAPIMTRDDIKLSDENGAMDWLFRNHPAFFSLKERIKKTPKDLYELDYRKVVSRWLDGITQFNNTSDITQDLKYLIQSEQFRTLLSNTDYDFVNTWLQDITTSRKITPAQRPFMLLRKTAAFASLGLNYASVLKQSLTQVVVMIIEKARPKMKSQYAEAFGIDVSQLPSITKRKGDIAIADLQGKIGRIFTGALTEFDRANAQLSLNALLDKEYNKIKEQGIEITEETRKIIEKTAQDKLDIWYAGFFKGQRPEAFRSQLGNFFNMFIYPLTSQLNGFYQTILKAKGVKGNIVAISEVIVAATLIAYLEQVITRLSFKWDDEKEMTKDTLISLSGNIPILSQIVYSFATDNQLQVSAGITGIESLRKNLSGYLKEEKDLKDLFFATGELAGLPKQIRRFYEGMEIIQDGGITDKDGKMLAPVKDVDEIVRSILRGKYGPMAAQDWVNNIGEKKENRRWFIPEVEFLQNGDYERKAELYIDFSKEDREYLKQFLSDNQKKKLEKAIKDYIEKDKIIDKIKQRILERGIRNEKQVNDIADKIYQDMTKESLEEEVSPQSQAPEVEEKNNQLLSKSSFKASTKENKLLSSIMNLLKV